MKIFRRLSAPIRNTAGIQPGWSHDPAPHPGQEWFGACCTSGTIFQAFDIFAKLALFKHPPRSGRDRPWPLKTSRGSANSNRQITGCGCSPPISSPGCGENPSTPCANASLRIRLGCARPASKNAYTPLQCFAGFRQGPGLALHRTGLCHSTR